MDMTQEDLAEAVASAIATGIKTATAPLIERLDRIEHTEATKGVIPGLADVRERLALLEARPQLEYVGTFDVTKEYRPGQFVSHQGGIWHAEAPSCGLTPSQNHQHWKLAVKAGRDGKDAR